MTIRTLGFVLEQRDMITNGPWKWFRESAKSPEFHIEDCVANVPYFTTFVQDS